MREPADLPVDEKRMPFSGHLVELRTRLILCIVAAVLGMIVAYAYCPDVFYPIIRAPLDAVEGKQSGNPFVVETPLTRLLMRYRSGWGAGPDARPLSPPNRLHYTSLLEPFVMRLKVSLVVGMFLALPVLAYEIWSFVSAGLYLHERRSVRVYGPVSLALFLLGAALAYFVVLPVGVIFLVHQGELAQQHPILTFQHYAPFVMWLMLGFGLVFQMPLVVLFLTRIGMVGPDTLTRSRRYAIVIMFVAAAFITPPDVFTMIAMVVPMLALYEISIFLSRFAVKRRDAP